MTTDTRVFVTTTIGGLIAILIGTLGYTAWLPGLPEALRVALILGGLGALGVTGFIGYQNTRALGMIRSGKTSSDTWR